MSTIHEQIVAEYENYMKESESFESKNVKAAAARARKALGNMGKLAKERRKENLQPCGVGEAVTSPGFNLPAEHLVHVVGPDCRRPSQDNFRRELLKNSYDENCEICGYKTLKSHCKIICKNCGFTRDCSDP